MKGTYFLVLNCKSDVEILVGKLGKVKFKKGFYVYVGSAMNSIEKRVARHLSKSKKLHWHIDYLTTNEHFSIPEVYFKESKTKTECYYARKLAKYFGGVEGFGSSDCKCDSHLFKVGKDDSVNLINLGFERLL